MTAPVSAFDSIAPCYHELWSNTTVGRLQRDAFRRHVLPLFQPGQNILDLGCGIGDDALAFADAGIKVTGIDSSREMVRIARGRGVDARQLPIENVAALSETWDGVISNFGAMNCVERLSDLREPFARGIRPRGWMALCFMNRFCLWETLWYAGKGDFGKAARRWRGEAETSLGVRVYYPGLRDIEYSFRPEFELVRQIGIGICVPPSYVDRISGAALSRLDRIDRAVSRLPLLRGLADHCLLLFRKR